MALKVRRQVFWHNVILTDFQNYFRGAVTRSSIFGNSVIFVSYLPNYIDEQSNLLKFVIYDTIKILY